MTQTFTIAVLGGTGQEGGGLALRWAKAGHRVILGSRDATKASAAAAEIIVLTVPFAAQRATVEDVREALTNKILIDATVPLVPPKVARVQLPGGGSAVAAIQEMLGDKVRVVSAFQNVSAHHLQDLAHNIECDVLVCGDDPAAREIAIKLSADMGLRGVHAGPIVNSAAAEALTSILIAMNMRYKVPGTGIRITGLPPA